MAIPLLTGHISRSVADLSNKDPHLDTLGRYRPNSLCEPILSVQVPANLKRFIGLMLLIQATQLQLLPVTCLDPADTCAMTDDPAFAVHILGKRSAAERSIGIPAVGGLQCVWVGPVALTVNPGFRGNTLGYHLGIPTLNDTFFALFLGVNSEPDTPTNPTLSKLAEVFQKWNWFK